MASSDMRGVRAISESLVRVMVHVFILVGLCCMLSTISNMEKATIEIQDCSDLKDDAKEADCYPTLWPGKTSEQSGLKRKEVSVFSQCYSGQHIYSEHDEYNFYDFMTGPVFTVTLIAVICLGLQVVILLTQYVRGSLTKDKGKLVYRPSTDPIIKRGGWHAIMWLLTVVTACLVTASILMFFTGISSRNTCGFNDANAAVFQDRTPGDDDEFKVTSTKCEAAGQLIRTYQASFPDDTAPAQANQYTEAAADAYAAEFKVFKGKTVDDVHKRYTKIQDKTDGATAPREKQISYAALSAYVLNCAHLDSSFQNRAADGADGVIKKVEDYKPREDLKEALQKVYSRTNSATWFLSASVVMLLYLTYSTGVLVRVHQTMWKSVHICLLPLVSGALFWIAAGMWDVYQAMGIQQGEKDNGAAYCVNEKDEIKENFVYTDKRETSIELWALFGVIAPLVIVLSVCWVGYKTVVHSPNVKASKKRDDIASGTDNASVAAREDSYTMHSNSHIVFTAIVGIALLFVLQRALAPMKYHSSNLCDMAEEAHASRYIGGMMAATVGSVFLVVLSFLYIQFGHHGIHMAHSWAHYHQGQAKDEMDVPQMGSSAADESARLKMASL